LINAIRDMREQSISSNHDSDNLKGKKKL